MHSGSKLLDILHGLTNLARNLAPRREIGRAEPVMANHPLLVGVRDGAALQSVHGFKRLAQRRRHPVEKTVIKAHAADIQRESECRDPAKIALMTLPEFC